MVKYKKYRIKSLYDNKLVIDNSFCGPEDIWKFAVYATRDVSIPKDTRLCQFRIQLQQLPVKFEEVEELEDETRGSFGSTGL